MNVFGFQLFDNPSERQGFIPPPPALFIKAQINKKIPKRPVLFLI